jgi:hypothetical protein
VGGRIGGWVGGIHIYWASMNLFFVLLYRHRDRHRERDRERERRREEDKRDTYRESRE